MVEHSDPLDIRGQEKAAKDREDRNRITRQQEVEDIKWLAADKRGRRILWELLERTGLFRNPFTGNSETFFRCGQMNVGQAYLDLLTVHAPGRFEQMIAEKSEHDNRKR